MLVLPTETGEVAASIVVGALDMLGVALAGPRARPLRVEATGPLEAVAPDYDPLASLAWELAERVAMEGNAPRRGGRAGAAEGRRRGRGDVA